MSSHLPNHQLFQSPITIDWVRRTYTGYCAGGECFLLPYPNNTDNRYDYILHDTGRKGTMEYDVILEVLEMLNIENKGGVITGIVITHVHDDHIGGLAHISDASRASIFSKLRWVAVGLTYMSAVDSSANILKRWDDIEKDVFNLLRLKKADDSLHTSISERKQFNDAIMRRVFCDTNGQVVIRGWPLMDTPVKNKYNFSQPINFYHKQDSGPLFSSNMEEIAKNTISGPASDVQKANVHQGGVCAIIHNAAVNEYIDEEGDDENNEGHTLKNHNIERQKRSSSTQNNNNENISNDKEDRTSDKPTGEATVDKSVDKSLENKSSSDKSTSEATVVKPVDTSPENRSSITTMYTTYPTVNDGKPIDKPKFYCFTGDNIFYLSHLLTFGLPHNAEFAEKLYQNVISHQHTLSKLYYNVPIHGTIDESILIQVYDELFTIHIHYDFDIMIQVVDNPVEFSKVLDKALIVNADIRNAVEKYIKEFKKLAKSNGVGNKWDAFQLPHHGSFVNSLGIENFSMFPLQHGTNKFSASINKNDLIVVYSQVSNLYFASSPGTEHPIAPEYIEAFQHALFKDSKILVAYPSLYPDTYVSETTNLKIREGLFYNQEDSPFFVLASLATYTICNFAPLFTYDNHKSYYDMHGVKRESFLSFQGEQCVEDTTVTGRKEVKYLEKNAKHVGELKTGIVDKPVTASSNESSLSSLFNSLLSKYISINHVDSASKPTPTPAPSPSTTAPASTSEPSPTPTPSPSATTLAASKRQHTSISTNDTDDELDKHAKKQKTHRN